MHWLSRRKGEYEMATNLQIITNKLAANPKRLFLVDGLGALLTALLLGVVLVRFEVLFGMPKTTLYLLSLIAIVYTIYSFCCCFFNFSNWRPYLKAIIIANILYCILTTWLVFYFFSLLTILGLVYFLLEIIVICFLIVIELRVFTNKNR